MKQFPEGVEIKLLGNAKEIPINLLLEADPSLERIETYLRDSTAFVALFKDEIIACCLVSTLNEKQAEVKNIAVKESWQGKGIAQSLLYKSTSYCSENGFDLVQISTGNSSIKQLYLYQKMGFRIEKIEKGYFLKNYKEEIWENELQCLDKIVLTKQLR